ncbi:hypothetical protein DOTSEDRAFT_72830 [Dothistroma septosporum NZE10]|uniref:Knr4/Smi1-like domain-containing protein n=1 Tax=Dothistroma septosporum (strain NZE10 / CBS 128990) TaxID=675120 RepID=M2WNK4_DOTSN|nr:hypothetical protein DOTSEDRAFT_72830 [Dothistroma septosporum NZE10]
MLFLSLIPIILVAISYHCHRRHQTILMSSSPTQNAQLQEVADLLLTIFETLAELRYVDPESIVRGPHDLSHLQDLYTEHNLDPSIRHLYTLLPYIDSSQTEARDFFHGGTFFDPTDEGDVEQGRNPYYAILEGDDFEAEDGPYMRPWYTVLSNLGNHQSVILYDAKMHRIWIVDQECWSSTDPGLRPAWRKVIGDESERSDWGDDGSEAGYQDVEEDDTSSHGSSEFWSPDDAGEEPVNELEQLREETAEGIDFNEGFEILDENDRQEARDAAMSKNGNSFEHIECRDAGDVLRDINRYYRELKEMPAGGEYNHEEWDLGKEILKPLYLKNGWPDRFDGDAFEVDQIRAYAVARARYHAEEPLRQVECNTGWERHCDNDIVRHKKELADAKDLDEEWTARFAIWQAEQRKIRNLEELKEKQATAERLCPGGIAQKEEDLPLWELERLESEKSHGTKTDVERYDGETEKVFLSRQRRRRHKAVIYTRALEAAKADAERLCPGRSFQDIKALPMGPQSTMERIEHTRSWMESSRKEAERVRQWAEEVPEEAVKTRELVQEWIGRHEGHMERNREEIERLEKWRGEHGDGE